MISRLTSWELGLAATILLLAGSEILQLVRARRAGLTENVSRLWSQGLVVAAVLLYALYTFFGWRQINPDNVTSEGSSYNWALVFLGVVAGLVISFELVALIGARAQRRTANVSRLLSHVVMLVVLVVLIDISRAKWEEYLELLSRTYEESLPPGAAP